ncbi:MAG: hypothetical protein ACE1Y4_01100, partial [Lysobacterales bacterium]
LIFVQGFKPDTKKSMLLTGEFSNCWVSEKVLPGNSLFFCVIHPPIAEDYEHRFWKEPLEKFGSTQINQQGSH